MQIKWLKSNTKSKNRIAMLVSAICCFLMLAISILNESDTEVVFEELTEFTTDEMISVSGYEVVGSEYRMLSSDPQIVYKSHLEDMSLIVVNLIEPTELMLVEIYYASEGESFNETRVVRKVVNKGESQFYIELPPGQYDQIRLDINGDFVLDSINWSAEGISAERSLDLEEFAIICLLTGLIFAVCLLWGDKILTRRNFTSFLIFIGYFLLHYKFLNDPTFDSDELDIMAGGKSIANGYGLYSEYLSQHMPISYYISALFELLGAKTIPMWRIAFYIFYAFMWTFIYRRYQDVVSKYALVLYPVIFTCLLETYDMGTVVLSEHLAGIGFVILLLEFINYYKIDRLNHGNCIMISTSILLTFGTTFVSAFGIATIGLGVLGIEINHLMLQRCRCSELILGLWKRYRRLLGWIIAPWVILLGSYAIQGRLSRFIFSAYTLNRKIYPKYLGGFGGSIRDTFMSIPEMVTQFVLGLFGRTSISYNEMLQMLVLLLAFVYIVELLKKEKYFIGVIIVAFVCALTTRGCFNFHGTQFVAVISLLASAALCDVLIGKKDDFCQKGILYRVLIGAVFVFVTCQYVSTISNIASRTIKQDENVQAIKIATLTETGEAVFMNKWWNNELLMLADRPQIGVGGLTPWTWEGFGEETLEAFGDTPPRVLLYDPNHELWGYKLKDYAPELVEYIAKHYSYAEEHDLYLRNDYYLEIVDNQVIYSTENINAISSTPVGQMLPNVFYEQKCMIDGQVVSGFEIMFGTYMRRNDVTLVVQLIDADSEEILITECINAKDFLDNQYVTIATKEVEIEKRGHYRIRMYLEGLHEGLDNTLSLYKQCDAVTESDYAVIDGEKQNFSFSVKVRGK